MVSAHTKIGILGLGLVGDAFYENLKSTFSDVLGYDNSQIALESARSKGIGITQNLQELVSEVDVILACVMESQQVIESIQSIQGDTLSHSIWLDFTTSHPNEKIKLNEILQTNSASYLDVCIGGNSSQIKQKNISLMVGGDETLISRIQPILECLSKNIYHCGKAGDAARVKLVFNMFIGLQRAVLAESLHFSQSLGLNPQQCLDIILNPENKLLNVLSNKGSKMIENNYQPVAKLDQHLKDVGIMLSLAQDHSCQLPLSQIHHHLLMNASKHGFGDSDNSAVFEGFESKN